MSAPKEDLLAQEIRSVDGRHSICAADLAEALMPFIEREFVSRDAVAELIEAVRDGMDMPKKEGSDQIGRFYNAKNAARLRAALARIGGATS